MTWFDTIDRDPGYIVTDSDWNDQVLANLNHLMFSRVFEPLIYRPSGNYTISGQTSVQKVDNTNLVYNVPSSFKSKRLRVDAIFHLGTFYNDANAHAPYYTYVDVLADDGTGAAQYMSSGTSTPHTYGAFSVGYGAGAISAVLSTGGVVLPLIGKFSFASAGAHTLKLVWWNSSIYATGTIYAGGVGGAPVVMIATEL